MTPFVLGVLFALASTAGATPQFPNTVPLRTSVLEYPSGGYLDGTASAIAAGQFSDDAIRDAVVLLGGALHFVYAPDRRNSWLTVGSGLTSIATRPFGGSVTMDDVLASDSTGLRRFVWDENGGPPTLAGSAVSGTAAFANATHLQVFHKGGSDYEVLALHVTGKFVVRAPWNSSTGVLGSGSTVGVAVDSDELVAVQWDSDAEPEYASSSPAGLRISDNGGAVLVTRAEANLDSVLARVTTTGQYDRVAWGRTANGTDSVLTVVRQGGNEDSNTVLPGVLLHALTTMDFVGDKQSELLLLSNYLPVTMGLTRGSTHTFNPFPGTAAQIIDLSRASSQVKENAAECAPGTGVFGSNMTPPAWCVADFDGDGDADLFVAGHTGGGESQRALVHFGVKQDQEAFIYEEDRTRAWIPTYEFVHSTASVDFVFEHPELPTDLDNPASQATHVRIVAWIQDAGAPGPDRDAAAVIECDLTELPLVELALSVPGSGTIGDDGTIHLEISYLTYSGAQMVAAYPAYHEKIRLSDFPTSPTPYVLYDLMGEDGSSSSGSTERPPISPPSSGGGGTTTP